MAEWTTNDLRTAILSNKKSVYIGSGAPGIAYDGQHWVDISTDPPVLKVYDLTNTTWMTMYPIYYETQSGAWANPSQSPITNGTVVVVYNSTQAGTRLYVRSNGAWANLDTASSPSLTGTAVVGEVKTGSTFYKDDYTKLTGNGTQTLSAANETVNAGYYAATTLSAVDSDLATGNVKEGVTVFGFAGTYAGVPATSDTDETEQAQGTASTACVTLLSAAGASETVLLSLTTNAGAGNAVIIAAGGGCIYAVDSACELRLYIDSTEVASVVLGTNAYSTESLVGTLDVQGSGNKTIQLRYYNSHADSKTANHSGLTLAGVTVVP